MNAIEQVLSIGSVKSEHPRLHAQAVAELAELEAAQSTMRPRRCCAKCDERAEAVREAAAQMTINSRLGKMIRAMPIPPCECNPLAPMTDDERVFGRDAWVYCTQHVKAHLTGWCSVSPNDKIGLGVYGQDNVQDAIDKVRLFIK